MVQGRVVERESQLAALVCYAEEARTGDGRMALVSGEAGIGKSTLVEELEATLPVATWWWGACDGLSTPHARGTDLVTRAALHDELADELALVERWDAAATTRQAAIEDWRQAGDTLREGAAEIWLGTVMWRLCRGPESVAARRRAKRLLEPLGPTEELGHLYAGGADTDDPDLMTAYIGRAADLARTLDLPGLRVRALNGVGYLAACRMGDYEAPLLEALGIALAHDMQPQAGQSYAI